MQGNVKSVVKCLPCVVTLDISWLVSEEVGSSLYWNVFLCTQLFNVFQWHEIVVLILWEFDFSNSIYQCVLVFACWYKTSNFPVINYT